MAFVNGNPTGATYSLGVITVATAGTPVLLSANGASLSNGFGTAGSPSPIVCNQIRIHNPSGQTTPGIIFLVYRGATAAFGSPSYGTGIVMAVEAAATEILWSQVYSNPFKLNDYELDASVSGLYGIVSVVIL